jgi:hypothetical protein
MQGFSFSCKARDLSGAIDLMNTMQTGFEVYECGARDMDWYVDFLELVMESAEQLGVSFRFGQPKFKTEIL